MFSILNEIKDYSPPSVLGVISSSIGSAASIYVLVAITGYMTFGNDVHPNIISMCLYSSVPAIIVYLLTTVSRSSISGVHHW
jgi:amino acid permease